MLKFDSSPQAIGQRLRILRVLLNIEGRELAKQAGISAAALSYWENGVVSVTTRSNSLNKVLKAFQIFGLNVSLEWLTEGRGSTPMLKGAPIFNRIISNVEFDPVSQSHCADTISAQLVALFSKELEGFSKISSSVVAKVTHDAFLPIFGKGDWVGGLWKKSTLLVDSSVCLVWLESELSVFYAKKTDQISFFDLFLGVPSMTEATPHRSRIYLEALAPICRIWR